MTDTISFLFKISAFENRSFIFLGDLWHIFLKYFAVLNPYGLEGQLKQRPEGKNHKQQLAPLFVVERLAQKLDPG